MLLVQERRGGRDVLGPLTAWAGLCSAETGGWGREGAWPLDEVLQEEVRPRRGEGGVKAEDGVSMAGEGDRDLDRRDTSSGLNSTPLT